MAIRSSEDERVYQQIEKNATYLNNATYATFLSFFNDLVLQPDNLGGQFYPLTTVAQRSRNSKPFIIGILPPSVDISGRLLDRSMSIAREDPSLLQPITTPASELESQKTETVVPAKINPQTAGADKWARPIIVEAFRKLLHRDPTLAEVQFAQAIARHETFYGRAWAGTDMEGSNNWGGVQCFPRQSSSICIDHQDKRSDGTVYKTRFRKYATPVDGAAGMIQHIFLSRPKTAKALADGGTVFEAMYAMRREHYYEGFCFAAAKQYGGGRINKSSRSPDLDEATKACAEEAITGYAMSVDKHITQIALATGDLERMSLGTYEAADYWWRTTAAGGNSIEGDSEEGSWATDGAPNAQNAAKEQDKTSGTPLNATDLGKAFTDKQRAQIAASQLALQQLQDLPPLRLLVNPQRFSLKESKIVSDGNRSRNGQIVEYWGDDQSKLSASGMLAAFYAMDIYDANGPGITRTARNFSAGFQNFQALYLIYRNNAAMYLEDYAGVQGDKNLSMLGSVYIYYDNTLHIGSFDSFDITETDEKPYTLEYSFEFSVRASFLLDHEQTLPTEGLISNG